MNKEKKNENKKKYPPEDNQSIWSKAVGSKSTSLSSETWYEETREKAREKTQDRKKGIFRSL